MARYILKMNTKFGALASGLLRSGRTHRVLETGEHKIPALLYDRASALLNQISLAIYLKFFVAVVVSSIPMVTCRTLLSALMFHFRWIKYAACHNSKATILTNALMAQTQTLRTHI